MSATTGLAGLLNRLDRAATDWLNRTAANLPGLNRLPGPTGIPIGAPPPAAIPQPIPAPEQGPAPAEAAPAAPDAAPPPGPAEPPKAPTTLEEYKAQREAIRKSIAQAEAAVGADPNSDAGVRAAAALPGLRSLLKGYTDSIAAEENRLRDEAAAAAAKASGQEGKPKNGDTRTSRVTHNGVTATITERYDNGQWSYVPNSATPETGLLGQQDPRSQVDLQTAQTNLQVAQQKLAEATSPEARELAQLDVEKARAAVEQARQAVATGRAPTVIQPGTSRVITTRDPLTGELRTQPNPAYTPEMAEAEQLQLEGLRRGTLPQDAYAAYTQERTRLQAAGRAEIDRLQELQQKGAISDQQAQAQWQQWIGPRQAQLEGLHAAADEAQRKERLEQEAQQRAENARVEALNRQREQLGFEAGQGARQQWMSLAPQVRTPQFLQQLGQSVANMSARAGAPSAEAALALPAGQRMTADTFNPERWKGAIPDLNQVAREATQRALSSISPAVAASINRPLPQLPTGPALDGMLASIPYQGPLSALPSPTSGLLPTSGREAVDLGTGQARTYYGTGNSYYDWPITG
jgi:hypothetical protein